MFSLSPPQQGALRRWQRRWFVLKDDLVLYSYKAPEVSENSFIFHFLDLFPHPGPRGLFYPPLTRLLG